MRARWLALTGVTLLIAACATSAPSSSQARSSSAADAPPAGGYQRCSASDPDRFAWFCVIGQIVYSAISGLQPASTPGLR